MQLTAEQAFWLKAQETIKYRRAPQVKAYKPSRYRPHQFGEGNPQSVLTWQDVREIRSRPIADNEAEIAREFGVNRSTICRIRRGESWKEKTCTISR